MIGEAHTSTIRREVERLTSRRVRRPLHAAAERWDWRVAMARQLLSRPEVDHGEFVEAVARGDASGVVRSELRHAIARRQLGVLDAAGMLVAAHVWQRQHRNDGP